MKYNIKRMLLIVGITAFTLFVLRRPLLCIDRDTFMHFAFTPLCWVLGCEDMLPQPELNRFGIVKHDGSFLLGLAFSIISSLAFIFITGFTFVKLWALTEYQNRK